MIIPEAKMEIVWSFTKLGDTGVPPDQTISASFQLPPTLFGKKQTISSFSREGFPNFHYPGFLTNT